MTEQDLDNIEAAAQGKTGVGVFAHPADTLLLIAEIRRLRQELAEEREAYVKVAERLAAQFGKDSAMAEVVACAAVAEALRARGKA